MAVAARGAGEEMVAGAKIPKLSFGSGSPGSLFCQEAAASQFFFKRPVSGRGRKEGQAMSKRKNSKSKQGSLIFCYRPLEGAAFLGFKGGGFLAESERVSFFSKARAAARRDGFFRFSFFSARPGQSLFFLRVNIFFPV